MNWQSLLGDFGYHYFIRMMLVTFRKIFLSGKVRINFVHL